MFYILFLLLAQTLYSVKSKLRKMAGASELVEDRQTETNKRNEPAFFSCVCAKPEQ